MAGLEAEITRRLAASEDEGERMAAVLGDKRVLLLRNHGALIAADSVAKAYLDLYQLERACLFQLLATDGGRALRAIPEEIAARMGEMARAGHSDPHFEAMTRLLDEQEPDYAQ